MLVFGVHVCERGAFSFQNVECSSVDILKCACLCTLAHTPVVSSQHQPVVLKRRMPQVTSSSFLEVTVPTPSHFSGSTALVMPCSAEVLIEFIPLLSSFNLEKVRQYQENQRMIKQIGERK